jgi:hypothetical protein
MRQGLDDSYNQSITDLGNPTIMVDRGKFEGVFTSSILFDSTLLD